MGVGGVFASIVSVLQAFALLWIVVIAVAGTLIARMFVRTRDVEWIRGPDEIDGLEAGVPQDTVAKAEGPPGAAA